MNTMHRENKKKKTILKIGFLLIIMIISLHQRVYAPPFLQWTQVNEWSKFITPRLNLSLSPVLTSFHRHSALVPFIRTPVEFDLVKRTLQKETSYNSWPQGVKKLCEECFEGDQNGLRQTFFNTCFSPGFFGAMCIQQPNYKPLEENTRFQRRPASRSYRDSKSSDGKTESKSFLFSASSSIEELEKILEDLRKDVVLYQRGTPQVPDFLFNLKKRIATHKISDISSFAKEDTSDRERLIRLHRELVKLEGGDKSTYFEEDMHTFFESIDKAIGQSDRQFLFSPKPNGVQFQVTYRKGLIQSASTVGLNGVETDLTEFLRSMPSVPGIIPEKKDVTFSGYLSLTKKAFHILNSQRIANGLERWLDPQSAINFALSSKEPFKLLDLKLSTFFDDVLEGDGKEVRNACHYIMRQGLPVPPKVFTMTASLRALSYVQTSFSQLPFATSGVMVSLLDSSERKLFKTPPKYICTYKVSPYFYEATIESISFKVQPTGVVSAVLNISPLTIEGQNVTKFVLPNETDFKNLGPTIKDKLILYCYPGLEPQIFTLKKASFRKSPPAFPSKCPKCESPLQWNTFGEKKVACCSAHLVCADDSVKDVSHFVSRRALNVPSLSDNLIKELVEKSVITTLADLFQLSKSDWQLVESVTFEEFTQILSELEIAKNTTLARFIYAINIPSVSPIMAEELAHLAGNIDRLKNLTTHELLKLKHVDKEAAKNVVKFLSDEKNFTKLRQWLKFLNVSELRSEVLQLCYQESYTQEDYEKISNKIQECDENPHVLTDFEYDAIIETAQRIESAHPEWKKTSFVVRRRERELASWVDPLILKKTYSLDEITEFCEQYPDGVVVEPKINGIACSLQYKDGVLVGAFTKAAHTEGKGFKVLDFIRDIPKIPKRLQMPFTGSVRGELFLSKEGLRRVNSSRVQRGLQPYTDSIAAIGPLTKSKNRKDNQVEDEVQFFGYHISDSYNIDETYPIETRFNLYAFLAKLGLASDIGHPKVFHSAVAVTDYVSDDESRRYDFHADIDGMVIKSSSFDSLQPTIGDDKYSREMLGYKFKLDTLRTTLRNVHFSTSKDGRITAVAELDPVLASNGRKISRVFVPSVNVLSKAHEGDAVNINYAGGVIPALQSIDDEKRDKRSPVIAMPKNCPACKTKLHHKEGKALRCTNPMCEGSSPSTSLLRFARGMEIGKERSMKKLIDAGLVKTPSDYYRILPEDLNESTTLSSSEAEKVLSAIEASKTASLTRLLLSLRIPKVGAASACAIVRVAPTLKDLLELTTDNMQGYNERKLIRHVVRYVQHNRDELESFLEMGVTKPEGKSAKKESILSIGLNQMYQAYRMREQTVSSIVKNALESIESINKENKNSLQLLSSMPHGGARRLHLWKRMREAGGRNERFLSLPLKKFLERQRRQ